MCSPYVDQITDVDEAVKDDENVVAQSIIVWGKDKGKVLKVMECIWNLHIR